LIIFFYLSDEPTTQVIGNFRGDRVRKQETRPFTIYLSVYDARLADTDSTITAKHYNVTSKFVFPYSYEIEVPHKIVEDDYRYAVSVSIRDPRNNNQLVWLTDTQTLIHSKRKAYDLYLKKIGV
jgi:uncharacterized lipoprotein YbaY